MKIEGHKHYKIEWFNDSNTCERNHYDCRFNLQHYISKAKAYMNHFGYKKAYIFENISYEDVNKELINLYKPSIIL